MKAADLHKHFRARGSWVNWDDTTDRFTAGDSSRSIRKVAVGWKASWAALRQAVDVGAEVFISHESICVNAVNGSPEPESTFALETEQAKFEWLATSGLVVYRCHDFWDGYPEGTGIRDSWRDGLDLGGNIIADAYPFYVTRIEPLPLGDLARHIVGRIGDLGQTGVCVTGDLEREVSRIATGTGVTTDPVKMKSLGAEAGVITDDYYLYVRMGAHAAELDFPTIAVNHGVSEQWGIQNLARYVGETFPELEVFHIPQYCPYTIVSSDT